MDTKRLGERIREIRYHLNLTQEKLGEKANLHYSYIGQVERGDKTPSFKALQKIADAFQIPIDELLKEKDNKSIVELQLNDIVNLLHERDKDEIDFIYKYIKELLCFLDSKSN